MTKTKSTKRALLMSALSLLMCVSMLIGSTFAWFTDSVSSTNNIIKSGNLDVELEYLNGDSWEKVTATTNVFEKDTLWEPGHTEVVYLKVSNLGTLALKYNLGINIVNEIESISVEGNALRLSDHIKFGVKEGVETPYADRAAARAAINDADAVKLSTGYTKSGSIEAGAPAQYVALVVYMPETVGNEANYKTGEVAPQIDLGINLMATQYTSESDSFDNQYDANAMFDGVPAARTTVLSKMPVVTTLSGNTVALDTGYVFNTTESYDAAQKNEHRYWHADFVATIDKDITSDDAGLAGQYDSYSADWLAFELSEFLGNNVAIPAGSSIRMLETAGITMNYEELCGIVKEFSCGAFAVNQEAMEGATLTVELRLYETEGDPNTTTGPKNVETGEYITIGKYSYTFGAKKVADVTTLANAIANGGDVVLTDNVVVNSTITVPSGKTVTLDLNGNDISYAVSNSGASAIIDNRGNLEIVGKGTISFVAENPDLQAIPSYATNTITNEATLVIGEGVVVTNESDGGASYAVDNKGVFTLDGGTLIGKRCALRIAKYNQDNVKFTMNSGLVKGATPAWIQLPGSNASVAPTIDVVINGGTFETTKATSADNNVMYTYSYGNSHANTSITINGGEFLGGTVSIGSGYKGDAPVLTINGGTFEYDVLQWLENDASQVLYSANK